MPSTRNPNLKLNRSSLILIPIPPTASNRIRVNPTASDHQPAHRFPAPVSVSRLFSHPSAARRRHRQASSPETGNNSCLTSQPRSAIIPPCLVRGKNQFSLTRAAPSACCREKVHSYQQNMKTENYLRQLCLLGTMLWSSIDCWAQPVTFTASTYAVGSGANPVAVADVNGDGKLDLICPFSQFQCADPSGNNGQGNTLVVLTNNGSGGFAANAALTVGRGPYHVATADVNGDGSVDLISANNGDNSLTVLTNNGRGGFSFSATLPAGPAPTCVIAAYLRGNGKPDLICPDFHANTVTVWFNNGDGTFGTNATLTVDSGPYWVAAADVNGDGLVDLICADLRCNAAPGNTLTVLTNNGAGGFGLNATLTVGKNPLCVAAADVNNDGKPDLISANFGDNSWTVLTNDGSGGFVTSATIGSPLPAGYVADTFAVGDFNGDGWPDLICGTSGPGCSGGDNKLIVLTNNGAGGFGYSTTLYAGNKNNVTAADLNGDGKLDLVAANYLDGTVTVMLNTTVFPTSVVSTFDTDADGWTLQVLSSLFTTNPPLVVAYELPTYLASGGNPGGCISSQDSAVDPTEPHFVAPAKFLGDKSAYYGGVLSFDVVCNLTLYGNYDQVELFGNGHALSIPTRIIRAARPMSGQPGPSHWRPPPAGGWMII